MPKDVTKNDELVYLYTFSLVVMPFDVTKNVRFTSIYDDGDVVLRPPPPPPSPPVIHINCREMKSVVC